MSPCLGGLNTGTHVAKLYSIKKMHEESDSGLQTEFVLGGGVRKKESLLTEDLDLSNG